MVLAYTPFKLFWCWLCGGGGSKHFSVLVAPVCGARGCNYCNKRNVFPFGEVYVYLFFVVFVSTVFFELFELQKNVGV